MKRDKAYTLMAVDSGEFRVVDDYYLTREAAQKAADESLFDAVVLRVSRYAIKPKAIVGCKGYKSLAARHHQLEHDRNRKREERKE